MWGKMGKRKQMGKKKEARRVASFFRRGVKRVGIRVEYRGRYTFCYPS